jgi:nucleoid DNA-binding protein
MALFKKKNVAAVAEEVDETPAPAPKKKAAAAPVEEVEEAEEVEEVEEAPAPAPKKKTVAKAAPVEEVEEAEEVEEVDETPAPAPKKKTVATAAAAPAKKAVAAPAEPARKSKVTIGGKKERVAAAASSSTSGSVKDIEDILLEEFDLTRKEISAFLKSVFGAIKTVTKAKSRLQISELAVFNVKTRPAYVGRNPQNGKKVKVPAMAVVAIKPTKVFKEFVRSEEE